MKFYKSIYLHIFDKNILNAKIFGKEKQILQHYEKNYVKFLSSNIREHRQTQVSTYYNLLRSYRYLLSDRHRRVLRSSLAHCSSNSTDLTKNWPNLFNDK